MDMKKYERQAGDEVVAFEGKVYCAKNPYLHDADGRHLVMRAIEEGALAEEDGMFPAVELEACKKDDGTWDVSEVFGPEQYDQDGGKYGILLWNEKRGFMLNYYNHIRYE